MSTTPETSPTTATHTLRVATWNMDNWKRTPAQREAAWRYLHESPYDVALLQEAVPRPGAPRAPLVWREIGRERRFGSGVISLKGWPIDEVSTAKSCHSYLAFPLHGTFPGSVSVARVHPPDSPPVTFVSMYVVMDVYSSTTLLRQVADLIPLFDSADGERVVLGGDLNITIQATADDLARAKAAFVALESLGLVDLFKSVSDRPKRNPKCTCGNPACYHVVTHRNAARAGDDGPHLDYLFASPQLAEHCKSLRLIDNEAHWQLSDHCPLVAEFELAPKSEPAPWDERYADEVASVLRTTISAQPAAGVWRPSSSRPVVRTDRQRTRWIAALIEGTVGNRAAQLELGIWREPKVTGHETVAYAGLLGSPMTERFREIDLRVPEDAGVSVINRQHASYVAVPYTAERLPPEVELQKAITLLVQAARLR